MTMQAQGDRLSFFTALAADNGVPSEGVLATETLTLAANAGNNETVTINTTTYTWKTTLTGGAYEVLIAASASDSIDNLILAILDTGTEGTEHGRMDVHPEVYAAAGAGDTMDITAKVVGTAANAYPTTETMANGSWGGVVMSSGAARAGIDLRTLITGGKLFHGMDTRRLLDDGKMPEKWSLEIVITGTGAIQCDPYIYGYEDAGTYGDDGDFARLGSGTTIGHVNGGTAFSGSTKAVFRDVLVNLGHLSWVYLEILNSAGTNFAADATLTPIFETME